MKSEIEAAMKALIARAEDSRSESIETVQFTQAALNLAHVGLVLKNAKEAVAG